MSDQSQITDMKEMFTNLCTLFNGQHLSPENIEVTMNDLCNRASKIWPDTAIYIPIFFSSVKQYIRERCLKLRLGRDSNPIDIQEIIIKSLIVAFINTEISFLNMLSVDQYIQVLNVSSPASDDVSRNNYNRFGVIFRYFVNQYFKSILSDDIMELKSDLQLQFKNLLAENMEFSVTLFIFFLDNLDISVLERHFDVEILKKFLSKDRVLHNSLFAMINNYRKAEEFLSLHSNSTLQCLTLSGYFFKMLSQNEEQLSDDDVSCVFQFILQADINICNKQGRTPLMIAASRGNFNIVRGLIEEFQADISQVDNSGNTCSDLAHANGHSNTAKYLLEIIGTIQCRQDADNQWRCSTSYGDLEHMSYILNHGVDLFKNNPLHVIAKYGLNVDMNQFCSTNKELINAKNIHGRTPFHEAIIHGNFEAAECLLNLGADVEATDRWLNTPLHYLSAFCATDKHKYLTILSRNAKVGVLKSNAFGVTAQQRLEYGSEYRDCLGNSEAHILVGVYASSKIYGCPVEVVGSLRSLPGFLFTVKNVYGQIPLHVVRSPEAIRCCLEIGGLECLRVKDKRRRNFWHMLGFRNDSRQIILQIEDLLLSTSDDLGIVSTDIFGRTPLHYAVRAPEFMWYKKWLMRKAGLSLTVKDNYGRYPMHYWHGLSAFYECMQGVSFQTEERAKLLAENKCRRDYNKFVKLQTPHDNMLHALQVQQSNVNDLVDSLRSVFDPLTPEAAYIFLSISLLFEKLNYDFFTNKSTNEMSFKISYTIPKNLRTKRFFEFKRAGSSSSEDVRMKRSLLSSKYKYAESKLPVEQHSLSRMKYDMQIDPDKANMLTVEKILQDNSDFTADVITAIVTEFIEKLIEEINKIDARFSGRLLDAGSSRDGTKVGTCDEFDFMVELVNFNECCDAVEGDLAHLGFVQLKKKLENSKLSYVDEFFDHDDILDTRLVKLHFEIAVRKVLSDARFNLDNDVLELQEMAHGENIFYAFYPERLATNFKVKFMKPVNEREIGHEISIDIVPAIHVKQYWPSSAMSLADVEQFCERVTLDSLQIKPECYLVFEQPYNKHPDMGWCRSNARVDFSILESDIIHHCPPVVYAVYLVTKQYVKYSGEFFKSYVLKSAFLHFLHETLPPVENCPKDIDELAVKWKEQVALRLLSFVLQDFVPSVFMPQFVLPVSPFEPYVKFSHIYLDKMNMTYRDILDMVHDHDHHVWKMADQQFENIVKSFFETHEMAMPKDWMFLTPRITPGEFRSYWPQILTDFKRLTTRCKVYDRSGRMY